MGDKRTQLPSDNQAGVLHNASKTTVALQDVVFSKKNTVVTPNKDLMSIQAKTTGEEEIEEIKEKSNKTKNILTFPVGIMPDSPSDFNNRRRNRVAEYVKAQKNTNGIDLQGLGKIVQFPQQIQQESLKQIETFKYNTFDNGATPKQMKKNLQSLQSLNDVALKGKTHEEVVKNIDALIAQSNNTKSLLANMLFISSLPPFWQTIDTPTKEVLDLNAVKEFKQQPIVKINMELMSKYVNSGMTPGQAANEMAKTHYKIDMNQQLGKSTLMPQTQQRIVVQNISKGKMLLKRKPNQLMIGSSARQMNPNNTITNKRPHLTLASSIVHSQMSVNKKPLSSTIENISTKELARQTKHIKGIIVKPNPTSIKI